MTQTFRFVALAALGIVAAAAGVLLARFLFAPAAAPVLATGTLLTPPRPLPTFNLIDQTGAAVEPERLQGNWSLMFFGFTHCGDICPTTLALLATTARSLNDLPRDEQPQIVFVSVDPGRDTPEVIAKYLANFDPAFVGLTGEQTDLESFTRALGVPSAIRMFENGSYAVDHSAAILAVNPRGELRAIFSPPHTVAALATDYRSLVSDRG